MNHAKCTHSPSPSAAPLTMFVSKSMEPTLSTMILYLFATGAPKLSTVS